MNGLVTDLQMFALQSLHIPLPGRHPPSPCLSNGLDNQGYLFDPSTNVIAFYPMFMLFCIYTSCFIFLFADSCVSFVFSWSFLAIVSIVVNLYTCFILEVVHFIMCGIVCSSVVLACYIALPIPSTLS